MRNEIMKRFEYIREDGTCEYCDETIYTTPLNPHDPRADWGSWCDVCEWHSEDDGPTRIKQPSELTLDDMKHIKRTLSKIVRGELSIEVIYMLLFDTILTEVEEND